MKSLYGICFFLVFLATAILPCCAAENTPKENMAATLFHDGQYEKALSIWRDLLRPGSSASLYFNIGLAESKLNHPAEAIYAYEQALRLSPLNAMMADALEMERKKLDHAVIPLNSFFLQRWYVGWITLFRPGALAILGLAGLLAALVGLFFRFGIISLRRAWPAWLIKGSAALGLIFLITACLSYHHIYTQDEGIVMAPCVLNQAPSAESPVLRNLSAGEKVRIKDSIGDWCYVALLNLDYGWIRKDCFRIIALKGY